jgi:AcrR family transcriptional regulator
VQRGVAELEEQVDAAVLSDPDPVAAFAAAVRAYLAFFDARPHFVELFVQERAEFRDRKTPTYFERQCDTSDDKFDFLRRAIAENRFRALPLERIPDVVGDLLYGTVFTNHLAGRRVPVEQQAAAILDVVFRGILSDAERARLSPDPEARP